MSDKLAVEVHDGLSSKEPVVTVLALYGGDDPESAAETIADFYLQVNNSRPNWQDAGSVAARFIMLQQRMHHGCDELGILGAIPIKRESSDSCQLVRIYCERRGPTVEFVQDAYTKPEELAVAKYILDKLDIETIQSTSQNQ